MNYRYMIWFMKEYSESPWCKPNVQTNYSARYTENDAGMAGTFELKSNYYFFGLWVQTHCNNCFAIYIYMRKWFWKMNREKNAKHIQTSCIEVD